MESDGVYRERQRESDGVRGAPEGVGRCPRSPGGARRESGSRRESAGVRPAAAGGEVARALKFLFFKARFPLVKLLKTPKFSRCARIFPAGVLMFPDSVIDKSVFKNRFM